MRCGPTSLERFCAVPAGESTSGASEESHIIGAGAANTAAPSPSRAASPPQPVVPTVTPLVSNPNFSNASRGLAAA
ncbi:hypothetical protein D0Q02_30530 [Micromonospora craniellae]|uniref:Uncharacterized protein n=1 Tax=Micromonospora craniellae TaxID=2294034 RepID=A0A372FQU2_9ACTN|nr:hypothetical protein D0Q02_30530 [Micromonospora craniellae]